MEMVGDIEGQGALFGREVVGERVRKAPESAAEKGLAEVRRLQNRDFQNIRNKLDRGKALTAAEAKRLEDYEKKFAGAAGEDLPEHIVRTQQEVAEYFKKNVRTVKRWVKRGMPELPDGYDLQAIEKWAVREDLIKRRSAARQEGGNGDRGLSGEVIEEIDYKQENEKLKLKIKKFEFAQTLGKFISRDEVERENITKITIVKRALLAQPRSIAPRLVGLEAREIEAVLMEHNRDIIMRFAQGGG